MKKRIKTISLFLLAVMSACIVLQACEEENSEVIKSEVINDETEYSETVNSESDFEETVYCEVDWHSLLQIPKEDSQEANPEEKMAHNIYSDPDLSATSGKFTGFSIDFKADWAGTATYWSLCNWRMNKDDLMSKYEGVDVYAGAYAGLQMCEEGPKAIMSFWETVYTDEEGNTCVLDANRIYPSGEEATRFGGEGEGTNYICNYEWEQGKWYRMYLNCYQDETGRTFVEQWIADLETEEWTLISSFDTGLYYSYFEGAMSQFMENYDYVYANETRSFEYRNICVREYGKEEWTEIKQTDLSVDTWWDNKKGNALFGATPDRFYGISNGYGPDSFTLNEEIRDTFSVTMTEKIKVAGK